MSDVRNGNPSTDATIDAKGVLKVNKVIDDVKEVTVQAKSESYGTTDSVKITLLPQVNAVNVEPTAISLFAVAGAEETVKVSLEPASVPLTRLTWTPSAKNVIEIEDHGDGTATIRPLKAGKVTVTVKENGGKAGKFTVTVMQPVEALELSAKGKAIPGKTVNIGAKLTPNNATDKTLTWALDVDENIATITQKGQIKLAKEAPMGTTITVTCTAEGAPEPVVATLELTVVEK